jgi:hypothetical protein
MSIRLNPNMCMECVHCNRIRLRQAPTYVAIELLGGDLRGIWLCAFKIVTLQRG